MAKKSSRDIRLALAGSAGAAVFLLSQCAGEDYTRYRYATLQDCLDEWLERDDCDYDDGYYYGPRLYSGRSYPKRKVGAKSKAIGVTRGGFGSFGARFGGGRS